MSSRQQISQSSGRGSPPACWALFGLALVLAGVGAAWAETVRNPRRLAEGPAGQLLVSERSLGAVVAIDKQTLQPVWSFVLPEETAPFGLATWNRLVLVGNTTTKNVEVYRMQGSPKGRMNLRFQYNLGHVPAGQTGTLESPISIAVDGKARLVFVLDGRQKTVEIYDLKGSLVASFSPRDQAGELMSPVSLTIDPARQEVLVGDFGDPSGFFRPREPARILIYDYQGELLFQIDGNGDTHPSTRFSRVQGMRTTGDGRIFVTEPLASRILVLDRTDGALLGEVGAAGPGPGQLSLPLDVHIDDKTGDLFVSNNQGARRVEVLRGAGR